MYILNTQLLNNTLIIALVQDVIYKYFCSKSGHAYIFITVSL